MASSRRAVEVWDFGWTWGVVESREPRVLVDAAFGFALLMVQAYMVGARTVHGSDAMP